MTTSISLDPVPVAAHQAGVCPWVVVPATVPCPDCRNGHWVTWAPDRHAYVCVMCNGSGVVPLSVSPGDRVRVLVSDRLPADGTRYGEWVVGSNPLRKSPYVKMAGWYPLSLRPGSVWTATVTDVLPIISESGCSSHSFDKDTTPSYVAWSDRHHSATVLTWRFTVSPTWYIDKERTEELQPHTVWQSGAWTPGAWVLRLDEWSEE